MNNDFIFIKDKYGEKMMKLCRKLFPTILECEGELFKLIRSNFSYNRFLADDIINNNLENNFKNFINSLYFNEEEVYLDTEKTPKELLKENGYMLFECKTEKDIQRFKRYYDSDEALCTFNGGRLNFNYVFFAIKEHAIRIKRNSIPKRDDKYSVSVLGIQFSKGNNNSLSIKSRYNHSVPNPDATFSNNLDNFIKGLTVSFEKYYGLNIKQNKQCGFEIPGYVLANDGKYYKYNYEINNIYYCINNIIIENGNIIDLYKEKEKYIIMDYFILDLQNKQLMLYDKNINDSFINDFNNISKIDVINNKELNKKIITIYNKDNSYIYIELDNKNNIIKYINDNIKKLENNFLYENKTLKELSIKNAVEIGNKFLYSNQSLVNINIEKVQQIGDYFLFNNNMLDKIKLDNILSIGNYFMVDNNKIKEIIFNSILKIGNYFMSNNYIIDSIEFKNLIKVGDCFLSNNEMLDIIDFPSLEVVGDSFIHWNKRIYKTLFSNLKIVGNKFMDCNKALKKLEISNLISCGNDFLMDNEILNLIKAKNLHKVGHSFLRMNQELNEINFENLVEVGDDFLLINTNICDISIPKLKKVGENFMMKSENKKLELKNIE